ncbi:MAG: hypothetical protein NC489_12800 [Ruminococcus flavefaciens]|nr:hypothetical protein [Ruminococcus flavefaciens]
MNEIETRILDEYVLNYRVEAESYRMMGKMLDEAFVCKRLELYDIFDVYIYGGTYLAAQLYRVIQSKVNVKGIIDKNYNVAVNIDVPILALGEARKVYLNEKIIITPIKYYKEICADLLQFVQEKNIILLGDFLEGL